MFKNVRLGYFATFFPLDLARLYNSIRGDLSGINCPNPIIFEVKSYLNLDILKANKSNSRGEVVNTKTQKELFQKPKICSFVSLKFVFKRKIEITSILIII